MYPFPFDDIRKVFCTHTCRIGKTQEIDEKGNVHFIDNRIFRAGRWYPAQQFDDAVVVKNQDLVPYTFVVLSDEQKKNLPAIEELHPLIFDKFFMAPEPYSTIKSLMKNSLKAKEQLDELSYDEIEKHRIDILTNSFSPLSDDIEKYLLELSFYCDVRFKDDKLARFKRWEKDVEEAKEKGIDFRKDTDLSAKKLVTEIGFDVLYEAQIESDLKKIGEFKFIKNIL